MSQVKPDILFSFVNGVCADQGALLHVLQIHCNQWQIQSGGGGGGSGLLEPPFETNLYYFHGEKKIEVKSAN